MTMPWRGQPLALLCVLALCHAAAAVQVFNQPHNGTGTLYQSSWLEPDGSNSDQFAYDSFQMASSQAITEIHWRGGHDPAFVWWSTPVLSFRVDIYGNNGNLMQPDVVHPPLVSYTSTDACGESPVGVFGGTTLHDYHFTLPSPFQAVGGTRYWVQITAEQHGIPDWGFAAASGGNGSHFRRLSEYQFQSISGDCAFSLYTSADPTALISATVEPVGTGSVMGAGLYPLGSSATLVATAEAGFGFQQWTENGQPVSQNSRYTFSVTANRSLVAHFLPTHSLILERWPATGGHVQGGGVFNTGSAVGILATPSPGHHFVAWLDGGSTFMGSNPDTTLILDSDRFVAAQFEADPATAVFDFDNAYPPVYPHQTMPSVQSQAGLSCNFTARSGFWSVQNTIYGWTPLDFGGNFLYPSTSWSSLAFNFDAPLTELALDFCTSEIAAEFDMGSLLRLRAYATSETGPVLAECSGRGQWVGLMYPEGRLHLVSAEPFQTVVVDFGPAQGGPLGDLFWVDNLIAVRASAPPQLLTLDAWPPEGGTLEGAGLWDAGLEVLATAWAAPGFQFSHWEEYGVLRSSANPLAVTMDQTHALTAVFAPVLEALVDTGADPVQAWLRWPDSTGSWMLEQSPGTYPPAWVPVDAPVSGVEGWNELYLPVTQGAVLYRLRRP